MEHCVVMQRCGLGLVTYQRLVLAGEVNVIDTSRDNVLEKKIIVLLQSIQHVL